MLNFAQSEMRMYGRTAYDIILVMPKSRRKSSNSGTFDSWRLTMGKWRENTLLWNKHSLLQYGIEMMIRGFVFLSSTLTLMSLASFSGRISRRQAKTPWSILLQKPFEREEKKRPKNCVSHKWFRTTIATTRELSIDIDSRLFRIQPVDHYHHDLLLRPEDLVATTISKREALSERRLSCRQRPLP